MGKLRPAFVTTQVHSLQVLPCLGCLAGLGTVHRGGCGPGDLDCLDLVCTHRRSVGSRQRLRASGDNWRMTEDSYST